MKASSQKVGAGGGGGGGGQKTRKRERDGGKESRQCTRCKAEVTGLFSEHRKVCPKKK
jgi:hypothetical protein